MKLHIEVTQEDISDGERGCGDRCMVWRAITRLLPDSPPDFCGAGRRDGSGAWVEWRREDGYVSVDLPDSVGKEMTIWDNGGYVRPFSFDLDLPDELAGGQA